VAEEVRKLAERSGKSTKEIAELIAGIQKEARRGQAHGEVDAAGREGRGDEPAGRRLPRHDRGQVVEVDKYSREIGAATQEQSSGSTQIAKARKTCAR